MSKSQQPLHALLQEYELVGMLGVGGFGIAYLGVDDILCA